MNNERDPITEWEHAIGRRIGAATMVCILVVIVGAMVAPLFGGWIKSLLYEHYALYNDCEKRVENTMIPVWIALWALSILTWILIVI